MGGKMSKMSMGEYWTEKVFHTPDAENPGLFPTEVSNNGLMGHFEKFEATQGVIQQVWIFMHNLGSSRSKMEDGLNLPKIAGLWHEFIVVKSRVGNSIWYLSFEKDMEGIRVQCGTTLESVKEYYRKQQRTGNVTPENRNTEQGREVNYGNRILDIFEWIVKMKQLLWGYHITERNCHVFASMLFEAITRQKGKEHRWLK